jgi:hypothetical protein
MPKRNAMPDSQTLPVIPENDDLVEWSDSEDENVPLPAEASHSTDGSEQDATSERENGAPSPQTSEAAKPIPDQIDMTGMPIPMPVLEPSFASYDGLDATIGEPLETYKDLEAELKKHAAQSPQPKVDFEPEVTDASAIDKRTKTR